MESFTSQKDVNTLILEAVDDRTLLELLKVNRRFLREGNEAFKRRMFKFYPVLASKKPSDMSWSKYYLTMIYYINKLKEDFDVDYIDVRSFNPVEYYKELSSPHLLGRARDTIKNIKNARHLVEKGDKDKIITFFNNVDNNWIRKRILEYLLEYKNISLFEFLLEKNKHLLADEGAPELIIGAARSGYKNIVDYTLKLIPEEGFRDYEVFEMAAGAAAEIGDLDMLKYLKEIFHETPDLKFIVHTAAEEGQIDFIKKFIQDYDKIEIVNALQKIISEFAEYNLEYSIPQELLNKTLEYLLNTYFSLGGDKEELKLVISPKDKEIIKILSMYDLNFKVSKY